MSERGEQSFYRDPELRKGILRKSKEIFGFQEVTAEAIDDLFLLEGEPLTEEEKGDVRRFIQHIGKRLVNAALHQPEKGPKNAREAKHRLFDPAENFGFIPFHDPAHAIVAYDQSGGKTLIPGFLEQSSEKAYTNPVILSEELPALVWGKVFGGMPLFVSFLRPETARNLLTSLEDAGEYEHPEQMVRELREIASSIDHTNFESVRAAYERTVVLYLKETAHSRLPDQKEQMREALDEMGEKSRTQPNAAYLRLLQNIFERYPQDKKTLFREFQRICAPLLERLRTKEQGQEA